MENKWRKLINGLSSKESRGEKKRITWDDIGVARLIIIILAGIFLLILSLPSGTLSGRKTKPDQKKSELSQEDSEDVAWAAMNAYGERQEKKIRKILSQVEGVGKVEVMVTIASSEEKKTLQDEKNEQENLQETDSSGGNRNQNTSSLQTETVLVNGGEGDQPYVVKLQSPCVEGVVVVAQGAGAANVEKEIIEAVQALFPVQPHKIKVMKME